MFCESRAESGDDDEGCKHAASRYEPERTTSEAFCTQCTTESEYGVPDLKGEVDASLSDGACDADALEDWCEVV